MAEPIDQETLAAAIVRAKGLMGKAIKSSTNPHFRSAYADYGAVIDATNPALQECDLSVEHITDWHHDEYCLLTWIQHKSGAKGPISYWPILWAPDKPQPMGSSLTYGKRYQHGLVCGVATEADDDGNAATAGATTLKSAAQIKQLYPTIEKAIRACQSVEELKRYGYEIGRIIVDWREQDKRNVRQEYDRQMTELEEGATEEGEMTDFKRKLMESKEQLDREELE